MNIKENKELKTINPIDTKESIKAPNPTGVNFKDEFNKLLDDSIKNITPDIGFLGASPFVQPDFSNFDIIETYNYSTDTIENVDAMFFLNISNQTEPVNVKLTDELSVIDATNYKTMEVSKTLGDLILKASENNKSVRLDFDDKMTVVLKVSKEGKIDATFFPSDKQVENYLKNNIDYLKVRFDEQNIAYSNISYKPYKERQNQSQNQNQNKNSKEKNNE